MPKKLDRCVRKVMGQGYGKSRAYAICSKATGWVKGKGGKWVKQRKEQN